jgi:hypothetical protein
MKVVLALLAAGMAAACEGLVVVVSTGPSPLYAGTAYTDAGTIVVGRSVSGVLIAYDTSVQYRVVAPSAGTLFVRVTWETSRGPLGMRLGDPWQDASGVRSPLTARLSVRAGQACPILISPPAIQNHPLNLPYTVVASME